MSKAFVFKCDYDYYYFLWANSVFFCFSVHRNVLMATEYPVLDQLLLEV